MLEEWYSSKMDDFHTHGSNNCGLTVWVQEAMTEIYFAFLHSILN